MRALPLVTAGLTLLALACAAPGGGGADVHVPTLAEIDGDADAQVDVVDRAAELEGALDAADAPAGEPIDVATVPAPFAMDVGAEEYEDPDHIAPAGDAPAGPATRNNVVKAAQLVVLADATAVYLVGVPAAAVDIALHGVTTEVYPNVWASTNTVSDGVRSVTGVFVYAWVGNGWIAEMRLWSSDGAYNDTRWFNGYLSADGQVGWWDFFDTWGTLQGVIEWVSDGENTELGMAGTAGDIQGDFLGFLWLDDGSFHVGYHEGAMNDDAWVTVQPDRAGQLRVWDYASGLPACWDTQGYDVDCE